MTVKNRSKISSHTNDKSPAVQHDESVKKSQKNAGPSGLMKLMSALFYVTLAGCAVLAALYFQQVLTDVKLMNLKHEESMERHKEMQRALQQVCDDLNCTEVMSYYLY